MRGRSPIYELIRRRTAAHPDATWLKWRDERLSWREALTAVERVANGLVELGVLPGERVAILLPNRPEFLWSFFGIQLAGAIAVPIDPWQPERDLLSALTESAAGIALVDGDRYLTLQAVRPRLATLRTAVMVDGPTPAGPDCSFERLMAASDGDPEVETCRAGGVMLYTSGTGGRPKGVVSTSDDWASLTRLLEASGIQPGETVYSCLPLFRFPGLAVAATGSILADAPLALADQFDPARLWDDCRRFEAVTFPAQGAMIASLLRRPPRADDRDHPVRTVLSTGCPAALWAGFERRFGVTIVEWFAAADAPGILLNDVGRVGSMGRAGVAGVEFGVVDELDRALGPGQVGELVLRHPKGRLTYYEGRPSETNWAYRGGWFHTGDLAEYDEAGFFWFRGRKDGAAVNEDARTNATT